MSSATSETHADDAPHDRRQMPPREEVDPGGADVCRRRRFRGVIVTLGWHRRCCRHLADSTPGDRRLRRGRRFPSPRVWSPRRERPRRARRCRSAVRRRPRTRIAPTRRDATAAVEQIRVVEVAVHDRARDGLRREREAHQLAERMGRRDGEHRAAARRDPGRHRELEPRRPRPPGEAGGASAECSRHSRARRRLRQRRSPNTSRPRRSSSRQRPARRSQAASRGPAHPFRPPRAGRAWSGAVQCV